MSHILADISSSPDTGVEQFLHNLTDHSEEPLMTTLKLLDLKKENIVSPENLILYLITNNNKIKYPEETVYKAIANLIITNNIPVSTVASEVKAAPGKMMWFMWLPAITGLCLLIFLLWKRKKKKAK